MEHTKVRDDMPPPRAARVGDEMTKMPAEPLLPIEKKLIGWSLGIGIVLLVVLVVASRMFLHAAG